MTTPTPADIQIAQSNLTPPHADSESIQEYVEQAVAGYYVVGNSGATPTVDYRNGKTQLITLNASAPAIALKNVPPGRRELELILAQDATGSRLIPTFTGTTVNYGTAGAPVLTTTASKRDLLKFVTYDSGLTLLFQSIVKGF